MLEVANQEAGDADRALPAQIRRVRQVTPDSVYVVTDRPHTACRRGDGGWEAPGCVVSVESGKVTVSGDGLSFVALRWRRPIPDDTLVLGDAWERSYGELQWRHPQPERTLPWYWLATSGGRTWGMGVRTRPGAMCSWTVAGDGVTLWLDVRSGGQPVLLGDRELAAATLVGVDGAARPYAMLAELCAAMSPDPLLPREPVVGCNNWYYAYGEGFGREAVVRDARTIAEYADGHEVLPYCVVDDGWTHHHGPWDTGFFDMAETAGEIKAAGARPGLWFRPLSQPATVAEDIARFRSWGYELIKHDFSSYDLFGRFAADTPATLATGETVFPDRTRTSAEQVVELYRTIAEAAGDALVIGCNTIGHLAAGLVQVQRTGDDTSGRQWERTRRMGVNTLAFRLPQHGRLFAVDADCVPCTPATDWSLNRQFLDLVARSGTALFVSVDPAARTDAADADLSRAVRLALDGGQEVEPLDWLTTTAPRRWRCGGQTLTYDWSQPWGAWPLTV